MTSDPSTATRVGKGTRRGIAWNLVGSAITNLVRIAVVAVLGRLLSSGDFGVVAAAMTVMTVLHTIRDIGVGTALVQRKELTPEHESTAFAVAMYVGVAMAIAMALCAPWIGALWEIPESVPILRVLGALFALRGMATVSYMRCQRELNFRAIALIDTTAYTIGSGVSIACAASGMGPWALVAGYLVEATMMAGLYAVLFPARMSMRIHRQSLRDLLGYGLGHTAITISSVLATQGDNFVVGRTLGKVQLGFYTRAYELVRFPSTIFQNVVGSVLFPAFARLQDDRAALAVSLRRTLFANAVLLLPGGAALVVVAPEAIRILMGPHWESAVLPFRIFSLTLLFRTSYKAGAIVARAAGDVYAVAFVTLLYAAAVIGGAAWSVQWGIVGVAVSTSIAIVLAYLMLTYLGMLRSGLPWLAFLHTHDLGLVLAGAVAAACWPLATWMRAANANAPEIAAVLAVVSGAIMVIGLAVAPDRMHPDLPWLRGELRHLIARIGSRRRKRSS
ncbi:MAG TPA: lipopolysaccharide biosynthesis protein [Kofleriaceae bacterium]|nr:lipopolysaccharide biosynthesis protein [Kofleriaceae bacterium]